MSGIVGIVNLDGAPVDHNLLRRITDFMSFRGPDAQEIWVDGNVGFGHTMLRTTWEAETEKQPLTLDGKIWLTADARIDGRAELISELEGKLGRRLRRSAESNTESPSSSSNDASNPAYKPLDSTGDRVPNDAELILYAYKAWGSECLKHLIGDFAFAIWDSRERSLFAARDRLGVKPFYYSNIGNTFVFSNTLNALRRHPGISDALNEIAIGDFLLFGLNQDLSTTTFREISRLPPAGQLTVSAGGIQCKPFWIPEQVQLLKYSRRDEYIEHFRELLVRAVDERLRTNQVTIAMSGGLDSPSVAAVAKDLLSQKPGSHELQAFCVVYDRLVPDDERYYAGLAASAIGIPITYLVADDYRLYEQRSPQDLEQPEPFLMTPLGARFNGLLRLLGKNGRVALSGWDGDALMNEPPRFHFARLAKQFRLVQLVSDVKWFVWSRRQLPPIGFRTLIKRLTGTSPRRSSYPEWIDEHFSKKVNLADRWEEFTSDPRAENAVRPHAFRVLNSASWSTLFETYDAGSSRLPLEVRHPLIDVRLVEYLLAIPVVPWCINKEILRVAMKGQLPLSVLNRPKTPLTVDPVFRLEQDGDVGWRDRFTPDQRLREFVDLSALSPLAAEMNRDRLWANLRLISLNHWLTHSLPVNQDTSEKSVGSD